MTKINHNWNWRRNQNGTSKKRKINIKNQWPYGRRSAWKSLVNFGKLLKWWSIYVIKSIVEYFVYYNQFHLIQNEIAVDFVENSFHRPKNVGSMRKYLKLMDWLRTIITLAWSTSICKYFEQTNNLQMKNHLNTFSVKNSSKREKKKNRSPKKNLPNREKKTLQFNRKNEVQLKTSAINSTAWIFEMLNFNDRVWSSTNINRSIRASHYTYVYAYAYLEYGKKMT